MKGILLLTLVNMALFLAVVGAPAPSAQAQGRPIALPPAASEVAHGIYDLGLARDADGTIVQGFAFIHYKQNAARPTAPGGGKPPKASPCYALMASGAAWKASPEPFVFDARNPDLGLIETAISTWEAAAGKDILGEGSPGAVYPELVGAEPNSLNEVMFGDFADPYIIAMTTVWGVWSGPPAGRKIVEWDMVFGNNWGWSFSLEPVGTTWMDFLNVATHEIGHAMGLDHPSDTCTEETMYAYADWRETKKRTLNAGDIAGIQKLYP